MRKNTWTGLLLATGIGALFGWLIGAAERADKGIDCNAVGKGGKVIRGTRTVESLSTELSSGSHDNALADERIVSQLSIVTRRLDVPSGLGQPAVRPLGMRPGGSPRNGALRVNGKFWT